MISEDKTSIVILLLFFTLCAWSLWKLARGAASGTWKRPGRFVYIAGISFLVFALSWIYGRLEGGLPTVAKACLSRHQPYDDTYYETHREDWYRPFPLSNKCNAHYDMVPAWVNPTVAAAAMACVMCLAGAVWVAVARSREKREKS